MKSKTKAAKYQRQHRLTKLQKGLCIVGACTNKLDTENYCQECLTRRKTYERKRSQVRAAKGFCYKCSKNKAAPYLSNCIDCWWKQKAVAHTGKVKHVQALKEIWDKQNGRCAISGLPLTPGLNASIDHIIPKSKKGNNKISNLQWVLTSVNGLKLDRTVEEVIEICKAIVSHNSK